MAKNLGKVTAYAHAKAGGYTGTEAEFNAMLAGLDEYNEAAAQSAEEASGYAEEASGYVTEASGYADNASESASDAAGSVEQAASIIAEAISYNIRRFENKYTVSSSTSSFTFNPTGYTYSNGDRFEVYVNGSKLVDDEYTNSSNVITLTTAVSSGTVEIIGFKNVDLTTDTTLSLAGVAADAKKTGDEIDALKDDLTQLESDVQNDLDQMQEEIDSFEGISEEVKVALLDVVSHIALWTDGDGQQYYDALYDALYAGQRVEWPDLTTGIITKGYYYDASGNTVSGDVNSDFINEKYFEIDPEQTYIWVRGFDGGVVENEPTLGATLGYRICYYDENKDFISRQVSVSYNTFGEVEPRYYTLNVPSNAKYFRVSWNRFPIGNVYKNLNDFYAVTLVLANLDDSNISSPSQLMEKFSVTRDGTDITATAEFTKPDLKPSDWNNISSARDTTYWRYNVFNVNQGGSPEYGTQNPSTRTRITNRYSLLCKRGDVIHFNNVKAGVRAERISDGDVQHTTAWITDNSDFVIGGE